MMFACWRTVLTAACAAIFAMVIAGPAHAYVDPGSGTFLLQILAAAAIGVVFYLRQARDFIFGLFRRAPVKEEPADRDE